MSQKVIAPRGMITSQDGDMLGAIVAMPRATIFATQDPDEELYIIARKSLITNIGWVFRDSVLLILPGAIAILLANSGINLFNIIPMTYQMLLLLTYYALVAGDIVINMSNWFFNVLIVTNKRILTYRFKIFASKKVSEANLINIEDVSQTTVGVLPSFFNYGDLLVQTAGQRNKFVIESVSRPTWLRDILVDLSRLSQNPEP